MLNVYFVVGLVIHSKHKHKYDFAKHLSRRGPDSRNEFEFKFNQWRLHFIGSVLWTQGGTVTKQPLVDVKRNVLLWNGDVFKRSFVTDDSDSSEVLQKLSNDGIDTLSGLIRIIGPYAFVYWDNILKRLWFGRDVIGRTSLLWYCSSDHVILTSVGNKLAKYLQEVPAQGIFMIDLEEKSENLELNFYPWRSSTNEFEFTFDLPVNTRDCISHCVIADGNKSVEWHSEEQSQEIQFYKNIFDKPRPPSEVFKLCFENVKVFDRVESFIELLSKSVEVRVNACPPKCTDCTYSESECWHSKIGVLFSGGLDSTVIALITDKYVNPNEPIDLYNVAFQNPTKKLMNFNVPDRKTGEKSLEELKRICPKRQWNFIKIDVTCEELENWRHDHIAHLIHPLNTVLDESIGCVLWFAARGQGSLVNGEIYHSPARVVLLGMGADEMLGGYMRHRTLWRREQCWQSLANILDYDLTIIWKRNLGRDNRIVADHGRQPRMPYLDENVVAFIQALPPWHRCFLPDEMPVGIGDKLLLRLAAWKLGLENASSYPKRAMQFGSRIANSREKGNDVSHRL